MLEFSVFKNNIKKYPFVKSSYFDLNQTFSCGVGRKELIRSKTNVINHSVRFYPCFGKKFTLNKSPHVNKKAKSNFIFWWVNQQEVISPRNSGLKIRARVENSLSSKSWHCLSTLNMLKRKVIFTSSCYYTINFRNH